jgi:hypothetical protein
MSASGNGTAEKTTDQRIRIYCYKFYTGIACGKQHKTVEIAMTPYLCTAVDVCVYVVRRMFLDRCENSRSSHMRQQ